MSHPFRQGLDRLGIEISDEQAGSFRTVGQILAAVATS